MKELIDYVNEKNRWNAMFKGATLLDLNNAADRQRIAESIDSALSPENLSCDGELPYSQVKARYQRLSKAARQLMKLDPTVQVYEL